MTALTGNVMRDYGTHLHPEDDQWLPMDATQIFTGAAVMMEPNRLMAPLVGGSAFFAGFCLAGKDASLEPAGSERIHVRTRGRIHLAIPGVTGDNLGDPVFAMDDNTFGMLGAGQSRIGIILNVTDGLALVEFKSHAYYDIGLNATT